MERVLLTHVINQRPDYHGGTAGKNLCLRVCVGGEQSNKPH